MIDWHMHFTGSLSEDFLIKCAIYEKQFSSFEEFVSFNPGYSRFGKLKLNTGYSKAIKSSNEFFDEYSKRQQITRSAFSSPEILYECGAYDIMMTSNNAGLKGFTLLCGMRQSLKETRERIFATLRGFNNAMSLLAKQAPIPRIRLTIIRDQNGQYVNFNTNTFVEILRDLRLFSPWVVGFDISGPQVRSSEPVLKKISVILNQERIFLKNQSPPLSFSIHLGEELNLLKPEDQFQYVYELRKTQQIDTIVHGSFFWLPSHLVNLPKSLNEERNLLLRELAKNKVFEISPTATSIMNRVSIVKHSNLIRRRLAKYNVKWRLCTDNSSIFCTSLDKEYHLLWLN